MASFIAQTGVNQPALDLFSALAGLTPAKVTVLPAGFRITLSATETVEVDGAFIYVGGVPTSGTITAIQVSVAGSPIYRIDGIALLWATALGYAASQAAALAAWPSLLSGNDELTGSSFSDTLKGFAGADTINGGGGIDTVLYNDKTLAVSVTLTGATAATVLVGGVVEDEILNIENVTGGSGNDTLTGDDQANILVGGSGDDALTGAGGQDVLDGGDGVDTAHYGDKTAAVAVTLNGTVNATVNIGGAAEDTIRNVENVVGGTGNDTLTGDALANLLDGGAGDDILTGMAGKDTLDGGSGNDTALYSEKTQAISLTLAGAANATAFIGGITEDLLRNVENVTGGSANDTLFGDTVANVLNGGGGDDTVGGRGGNDTLDGGTGTDTADFADKTASVVVTLNGTTNAVATVGGVAEDVIRNFENVVGGSAADTLTGDGLANTLTGGAGNDQLSGAGGDDLLIGQADNDTLDGGAGGDTASYAEKTLGIAVTLNGATNAIVTVGGIDEDTLRNVEHVVGGSGNDQLIGDALGNRLAGNAGNDVLEGRGGADSLDGGFGIDTAIYAEKSTAVVVTLNGGIDAVVSVGGVAEDLIRNIENVTGGSGNDILTGDAIVNVLTGGQGNDTLTGGAGIDTLDGGAGSDTANFSEKTASVVVTLDGSAFVTATVGGVAEDALRDIENVTGGSAADTLTGDLLANTLIGNGGDDLLRGMAGQDVLDGGAGIDTASFQDKTAAVVLTLNGAVNAVASVGGVAEDTVRNVENVIGGSGADVLTGDGLANLFMGAGGNDSLSGGLGNDWLIGGEGADTLDGGQDIDTASYTDKVAAVVVTLNGALDAIVTVGGVAEDSLRNIENLVGGDAADTLTGDASANLLDGGLGNDTLNGGLGNDLLIGGGDQDHLDGAEGIDTASYADKTLGVSVALNGAAVATLSVGGVAEDTLANIENVIGGSAGDELTGDDMANRLEGGAGDDILTGLGGNDTLEGGLGNDTASFADKTLAVSVVLNTTVAALVSVDGVVEDTIRDIENLIGGAAGDTLTGDGLANRMDGGDGDDRLQGMAGNDTLDGGIGIDTAVYAEKLLAINVTLAGSANATVMHGTLAEDTIRGIENVIGGNAGDTLSGDALANRLEGRAGDDLIAGRDGNDTLDGGTGIDTVSFAEKTQSVVITLNGSIEVAAMVGGVVEDTVVNFESVLGGSADDVITGDAAANVLDGGAGNDILNGGDNNDMLLGAAGNDTLDGGAGQDTASYADTALSVVVTLNQGTNASVKVGGVVEDTIRNIENIIGGSGADVLTGDVLANEFLGGGGKDTVNGGGGIDTALYTDKALTVAVTLNGATAATVLIGGLAEDTLSNIENVTGGSANDVLTGDALGNALIGGAGDDTLKGAGGQDVLDGGIGTDTALFNDKTDAVEVALAGAANAVVTVGGAAEDTLRNIENVTGGSGNDTLLGDQFANLLDGGSGNDTLRGGGLADVLDGGTGIDTALFTDKTVAVVVTLAGASNAVATVGGVAEDTLRNIENVTGGTGNDTLTGDALANELVGGNGDDTLLGAGGLDLLDGGAGIDTASFADKAVSVQVALNGAVDVVALVGGATDDTLRGIENLIGGSAADTLTGDAGANTLDGGGGADTLTGGGGNDLLIGRGDKDVIDGQDGIDTISFVDKTAAVVLALNGATFATAQVAGVNEDTVRNVENIIGGSGADQFTGDGQDNVFLGGLGADTINGGAGVDTALYTDRTQSVVVTLNGATAATVTIGGVAEDALRNVENVTGGSAADTLTGDALANALLGGQGDDTLAGMGGIDLIDGDAGTDTVLFTDKTASVVLTLNGATATTAMVGGVAEDTVVNVENVTGGSGDDALTGDSKVNWLLGGNGHDTLTGGLGADRLDGGAGIDTASFADKTLIVVATLNGSSQSIVTVGGANEDTILNIENLVGGSAGDTLTGDALANVLMGGGGKDVLDGAGGIDTAVYTDKLMAVAVTLSGATYATVTVGGVIEDTIRNIENVIGGDGDDVLTGDSLDNLLVGGLGDDTLMGAGGNDTLEGGGGSNTAVFTGASTDYTIAFATTETTVTGIEGVDTLRGIQYLKFSDTTLSTSTGSQFAISTTTPSKAEGDAGTTPFTFNVTRTGNLSKAQTVSWSTKGSTAVGVSAATPNDFVGKVMPGGTLTFGVGETKKTVTVNVAGDLVGETDDGFTVTLSNPSAGATLSTASASTVILNDDTSLTMGFVATAVNEGKSGNTLFALNILRTGDRTGSTTVNWATIGGQATASDFAGAVLPMGSVTFAPGETAKRVNIQVLGDTTVEADETFAVTLYNATGGANILTMLAEATILSDDGISGTTGNNTLTGTLGNDLFVLIGGNDTVIGSAGLDRFQFMPGALGSAATSTISLPDFDRSLAEVLDLSLIDAIAGTLGDDAFTFIDTALFGGVAGQLRWMDTGAARVIQADVNGDSVADLTLSTLASGPVTADWFRL